MSIAIWAPVDSALCAYYGLYPAIALNAVVTVVLLALLISVRRLAHRPP